MTADLPKFCSTSRRSTAFVLFVVAGGPWPALRAAGLGTYLSHRRPGRRGWARRSMGTIEGEAQAPRDRPGRRCGTYSPTTPKGL